MEIYVVGPTASGKSGLAVEIAQKFNGEIISADSMQIYKELNVGTAKVMQKEMKGIPHHLINVVSYKDEFSVAEFCDMANEKIEEIKKRNHVPIIVGGTGLYIHSLLYQMNFANVVKNPTLRKELEKYIEDKGLEEAYNKLKELDLEASKRISVNDKKRIIRSLEIIMTTNKTLDEQQAQKKTDKAFILIFINPTDREKLYNRINMRVDKMFDDGLLEEIKTIDNYTYQSTKAIGYREFADVNVANITAEKLVEIKEKIKQDTRRFAKRQLTWFKQYDFAKCYDLDENEKILQDLEKELNGKNRKY